MRARTKGWPKTKAPFSLGGWGKVVNVVAILWGAAMMLNFLHAVPRWTPRGTGHASGANYLRIFSNPKPIQTDYYVEGEQLVDFKIDFLNKIPVIWTVFSLICDRRRDLLLRGPEEEAVRAGETARGRRPLGDRPGRSVTRRRGRPRTAAPPAVPSSGDEARRLRTRRRLHRGARRSGVGVARSAPGVGGLAHLAGGPRGAAPHEPPDERSRGQLATAAPLRVDDRRGDHAALRLRPADPAGGAPPGPEGLAPRHPPTRGVLERVRSSSATTSRRPAPDPRRYCAVQPPSTTRTVPVTRLAAGDAR